MAYTTIKKPSDYFNTKLYSGSASSQSITGVGFQPDLIIVKNRTTTGNHYTNDIIRGASQKISTNSTSAEFTQDGISSFDSDGFTVGTASTDTNNSGNNYVSWNWLANNTSGSSNTDGSITSTVSANTTAGFSIVSYTGNGSTATVGHGLGATVDMVIVKDRTRAGENWVVYHKSLGKDKVIYMNLTNAVDPATDFWGTSTPNSSVFGLKSGNTSNNWSGDNFIAYCFAEKTGYSKFGSYTGNGSSDGTFVYTGFKPAWVLIKHASGGTAGGESWNLQDVKRSTYNPSIISLFPNTNDADNSTTNNSLDILSNGFKVRTVDNRLNNSGASYIYMAFAAEPLVGDNPATAR